jgi:hypothetical protein
VYNNTVKVYCDRAKKRDLGGKLAVTVKELDIPNGAANRAAQHIQTHTAVAHGHTYSHNECQLM